MFDPLSGCATLALTFQCCMGGDKMHVSGLLQELLHTVLRTRQEDLDDGNQ